MYVYVISIYAHTCGDSSVYICICISCVTHVRSSVIYVCISIMHASIVIYVCVSVIYMICIYRACHYVTCAYQSCVSLRVLYIYIYMYMHPCVSYDAHTWYSMYIYVIRGCHMLYINHACHWGCIYVCISFMRVIEVVIYICICIHACYWGCYIYMYMQPCVSCEVLVYIYMHIIHA